MSTWTDIGARIASGFDIPPGGLVVLRDRCGRAEVLEAVVIAFEHRGITTVIDPASDNVLNAVLSETDPALLATWGRHRSRILELADGVVSLGAGPIPTERASAAALSALRAGREAMEEAETRSTLPFLAVAIPTPRVADSVGRPLADLDRIVGDSIGPAVEPSRELFQLHIARAALDPLTLITPGCSLVMSRGDRPWLPDDGHISAADLAQGATASNLPCGSIYATVLEDRADGTVRIPEIADGHDVVLTFRATGVVSRRSGLRFRPAVARPIRAGRRSNLARRHRSQSSMPGRHRLDDPRRTPSRRDLRRPR